MVTVMRLWVTDYMGSGVNLSHDWDVTHASIILLISLPAPQSLKLRVVCGELGKVTHKVFKIGVQLGIPYHMLKEFEKETDPLSAVINYWLNDNVEDAEVPVSWRSIVAALESSYVGETGLANKISRKYCKQENTVQNNG